MKPAVFFAALCTVVFVAMGAYADEVVAAADSAEVAVQNETASTNESDVPTPRLQFKQVDFETPSNFWVSYVVLVVLILLAAAAFIWLRSQPGKLPFAVTETLSLESVKRLGPHSRIYVLDSGHERLAVAENKQGISVVLLKPRDSGEVD